MQSLVLICTEPRHKVGIYCGARPHIGNHKQYGHKLITCMSHCYKQHPHECP